MTTESFIRKLLWLVCGSAALGLLVGLTSPALGQPNNANQNGADRSLRASGRVNPSSLAMEINIPLGGVPGRGLNLPLNLSYSSKVWRLEQAGRSSVANYPGCFSFNRGVFSENSASGWTSSAQAPYIEYTDVIFYSNGLPPNFEDTCGTPPPPPPVPNQNSYIRRLMLHLPSGETHELRMDDTVITYNPGSNCNVTPVLCDPHQMDLPANWTGWYYAVDGSNLKYFEDRINNIYYLLLPDGSRYDFVNTRIALNEEYIRWAAKITDRNGNAMNYFAPGSVDSNGITYPQGYWQDTLGRSVGVPFQPVVPLAPTTQNYQMPGMSGQYKFRWKQLKGASAAESGLTDFSQALNYVGDSYYGSNPQNNFVYLYSHSEPSLFASHFSGGPDDAGVFGTELFNPVVLSEIELPTGAKYKFTYDVYGEIEQVYYPSGGEEKFEYGFIPALARVDSRSINGNRGILKRKVYETVDAGTPIEWNYAAAVVDPQTYKVTVTAPDNTRSERLLRIGAPPGQTSPPTGTFGYDDILAGMAFDEREYSSAGALLSKKLTNWTKTTLVVNNTTGFHVNADWHPRVTQEESIIYDPATGAALSTTTTMDYGDMSLTTTPLNLKTAKQYGFTTTVGGLGALQKSSEIDYSTDTGYLARNLVSLPVETRLKDPSGNVVAQSQIAYDESNYQDLTAISTTGWQNPNTAIRGEVTTTKIWDSSASSGAGDWVITHAKYDCFGNAVQTWSPQYQNNPVTRITTTAYSSSYNYAFPTTVTTPVPDTTGHGSSTAFVATSIYDLTTGLPLSTTDANGVTTTIEYNDPLLRPTRVSTAVGGQPVGTQTVTEYGVPDASGTLPAAQRFVHVKTQIDASNWAESWQWMDGLGRTVKSQKRDAAGDVFAITNYDLMGRVSSVSNPFRNVATPDCATTVKCTTSIYDDLSRVKEIDLPLEAGQSIPAKVLTGYSLATTGSAIGTTVTVTDQAGKLRRSITNALGQLIRVDEPDSSSVTGVLDSGSVASPKQPTAYTYDTLGNLLTVTQSGTTALQCTGTTTGTASCSQTRSFVYDSLSRLKSATNPESGLISYTYDAAGNLLTKTDARWVKTSYVYDALNRVTTRSYGIESGHSAPTNNYVVAPAVDYYYDGKYFTAAGAQQTATGSVKGKLTSVKTAFLPNASYTNYTAFDALGRTKASQQITDGTTYTFSDYSYNLAGALISETYPSLRQVKTVLNADGDLAAVASRTKATNPLRTYASNFSYTAAGAVSAMQLGNTRWETSAFNNRLQPTQLGLGTTNNTQDLWKATFDYGTSDNNGNVKSQTIIVPNTTVGGTTYNGFSAVQTYAYDSLNRLQSASEKIGTPQTWKQTFQYDRFGNRQFDLANTTTPNTGQGAVKVINPVADPNTNRLKADQDGDAVADYLYDSSGNMTRDAAYRKFTYDGENKQSKVETVDANGNVTSLVGSYVYDGDGKRIKKIAGSETTIFVYDASGKLAAEYSTAPPPPPATATTSYLTNDHLGSPRVITDQSGKVTSRRDFLPFGEDLSTPQRTPQLGYLADNIRQGFTGYLDDEESGLEFAEARMYANQHGRFTSPDPLLSSGDIAAPESWNRYAYSFNNPLKFTDPVGLYVWGNTLGGIATDAQLLKRKGGQAIVDQRNQFRNALAGAAKAAASGSLTKDDQAKVSRAVGVYGKEGVKNGVAVFAEKIGAGGLTLVNGVAGKPTKDNPTGQNIGVYFDPSAFGDDTGFQGLVAHEGSHAADGAEWVASGFADSKNPTKYATEFKAYTVQSLVAQANGDRDSNLRLSPVIDPNDPPPFSVQIWSSGWAAADIAELRKQNINKALKYDERYKVTPESQGKKRFEVGKRFQ